VTSLLSLKRNHSLSTIHDFRRKKTLMRCVSHFSTNTQAIEILFQAPLIKLAADDTAVVTQHGRERRRGSSMNSFTLTAVGNLARNPEAVAKGDITFTRFCLVGNDYAGKDDEGAPREIVTTLWFVAFGTLAELLVHNARKGDQLIVEARVRSNNWTDKQGEKQYDHDFVVQGFRYGAPGKIKREERRFRREEDAQRGEERSNGRDGAAVAGGVGGTANGHSSSMPGTGGLGTKENNASSAIQSSSGPSGNVSADRTDRAANTQPGVATSGNGATSSNGTEKGSGSSGSATEKPSGSRSSRRAAASPP
jgi:single-strand DNA-binding protein